MHAFSRAQDEKLFWRTNLAHGAQIWLMANSIWQILAHKFFANGAQIFTILLVKLNGNFFAKRCGLVTFRLAKKVW